MNQEGDKKVRIDRWLWAARFFKTRSLAGKAVKGGHIQINGERVKPARLVGVGDELRIRRGYVEFTVIVRGLGEKRGPAKKITKISIWIRNCLLAKLRTFTSVKTYGPIEFFMTVLAVDMVAPTYGKHHLKEYFFENKASFI